jgi:hypothetical protein
MLTQTENTLYILQNLANTQSKDLEFTEIEVYYEDDKGNEGSTTYDMPTIADDAIITINHLTNEIAELKKQLLPSVQPLTVKIEPIYDITLTTHIDDNNVKYRYIGENSYEVWMSKDVKPYWREMPYNNIECASNIRSVSDIKMIAELEKELNSTKIIIIKTASDILSIDDCEEKSDEINDYWTCLKEFALTTLGRTDS